MNDRNARYDQKRHTEKPWRRWYSLKAWKTRRARHLAKCPWCVMCEQGGRARKATAVDHDPPHRGNWKQFISGPLMSLCKPHHDEVKQRAEANQYSRAPGAAGWPDDPNHPFNRKRGVGQ